MRLNNLTNKSLAELLCVGVSTISGYRTGYRLPDSMVLCHLCAIFGVSPDYMLGYSDSYDHNHL
ncbi:helix-turn-helix domain-containing protein [Agathobacter sp.]